MHAIRNGLDAVARDVSLLVSNVRNLESTCRYALVDSPFDWGGGWGGAGFDNIAAFYILSNATAIKCLCRFSRLSRLVAPYNIAPTRSLALMRPLSGLRRLRSTRLSARPSILSTLWKSQPAPHTVSYSDYLGTSVPPAIWLSFFVVLRPQPYYTIPCCCLVSNFVSIYHHSGFHRFCVLLDLIFTHP